MGSTPTPVDVGFAEFVSLLMSETLESVLSAQVSQEQQRAALLNAVTLGVEEFSDGYVTEADIDLLLIELLPDGDGGTVVVVGGKVPPKALLAALGVTLRTKGDSKGALAQRDVDRIREAARRTVGSRRLAALQDSARQGIPRIVVDEGRIVAKLTFSTVVMTDDDTDQDSVGSPTAAPAPGMGRTGLVDVGGIRAALDPTSALTTGRWNAGILAQAIPGALKDIRLLIKPASAQDPQSTTRAEIYGEVELRFQTIF